MAIIVRWRYENEDRLRVESFDTKAQAQRWIKVMCQPSQGDTRALIVDTTGGIKVPASCKSSSSTHHPHHATKKKSATQLQREIDEALASKRSHATKAAEEKAAEDPIARLQSALAEARSEYSLWARQESLTRDERDRKMQALRRVQELEAALHRQRPRRPHTTVKESHATTKTIAAPVHHDRLATAIARVVRDPYYWSSGSFDLDSAMQVLPKLQGAYDWRKVTDWVDDYLQDVRGTPGATGGGIPERATRGVGGHEIKSAQAMIQRVRRHVERR